jgi:hypothetical protein
VSIYYGCPFTPRTTLALIKYRFRSGDMVKVHVKSRKNMKSFTVCKNLVMRKSPFFAGAFASKSFRESHENEIKLTEDHPFVFEIILNWMYTFQMPSLSDFLDARSD